jgi:PAS domain S-box-containing protein
LLGCLTLLLAVPHGEAADSGPTRRVLVLQSYHKGFTWTDSVQRGLEETFASADRGVEVAVEYMDLKRHEADQIADRLAHVYSFKYARWIPDLVVACDDDAVGFALERKDALFADTPLVFCGLNVDDYDPAMLAGRPQVTGVVERLDFSSTIELILELQPEVRHIAFITDRTTSGEANRRIIEALAPVYADRAEFIFFDQGDGLTGEELLADLAALEPDTAVYFLDFARDSNGAYHPPDVILPRISRASPVPVYTYAQLYFGHGVLGGKLLSGEVHGLSTAGQALRVLAGADPAALPVLVESSNRFMFDDRQLRRFGIPESALPEGSIVAFGPTSFLERHRVAILWSAAGVAALLVMVALLLINTLARRKMEKRLQASEELYRRLVQDARAIVVEFDAQGRMTFMNDYGLDFFGYRAEEIQGRHPTGVITPAVDSMGRDLDCIVDLLAQDPEGMAVLESENMTRNGRRVRVSWSNRALRDESGELRGFVSVGHDVTDRHEAEALVRESEARYRLLADNVTDMLWVTDECFGFSYVSPAVERILGYTPEEFLLLAPEDYIHPDSYPLVHEAMLSRQRLERRGRGDDRTRTWELKYRPKGGGIIWVETTTTAVREEDGSFLGLIGVTRDITARKLAELELRESERRYASIFENAPVGIYQCTEGGRLLAVNPAFAHMLGYDSPQDVLERVENLATDVYETSEERARLVATLIEKNFVNDWELRLKRKDGSRLWAAFSARVIRDEKTGGIHHFKGFVTDISERKELETLKEDVDRILRHDIRSPAVVLGNGVQLLRRRVTDAESKGILDEMERSAHKLVSLLDLSRDLSLIERGEYTIEAQPVDLLGAVAETANEVRMATGDSAPIDILIDGRAMRDATQPAGGSEILAERLLLEMLLRNLLLNAVEASLNGEPVRVELETEPAPRLTIWNRGVVPEQMRGRFFSKYATAGKRHGTGLGTYTAKKVAEAHGWEIDMHTAETEGTTIRVDFLKGHGEAIASPEHR